MHYIAHSDNPLRYKETVFCISIYCSLKQDALWVKCGQIQVFSIIALIIYVIMLLYTVNIDKHHYSDCIGCICTYLIIYRLVLIIFAYHFQI